MAEAYETKVRPEKVEKVQEIKGDFSDAGAVVLTEYRGLTVTELAELRRSLTDVGTRYRVVKNTLARLAARELGWDELDPLFEGPTAIAYCRDDPVAVAKALTTFAKDHPDLVIKGAVLEGRIMSAEETEELARIDPLDVSLAKISGSLTSSLQAIVGTLEGALRQILFVLQGLSDAGEAGPLGEGAPEAEESPAEESPGEEAPAEEAAAESPSADDDETETKEGE